MIATATENALQLLTDQQMRQFVTHGCLVLQSTVPAEINEAIYRRFDEITERKRLGNNNILPQVQELQDVFSDPVVSGAVTSVAGPGAVMHPHRAIHSCGPGAPDGAWHKDSYWGYTQKVRNHRPWWVMVMYYPQDTFEENGPTAVLPGRFAHLTRKEDDAAGELKATGKAGTFILIQYDIWHRATANTSQRHRYMGKFEFIRMQPPTMPTWDCKDRAWCEPDANAWPVHSHRTMARSLWNWNAANGDLHQPMIGDTGRMGTWMDDLRSRDARTRATAADALGLVGSDAAEATSVLIDALADTDEPVSMNAAYALAAIGPEAVPPLIKQLHDERDLVRRYAGYALAAMGVHAAAALIEAAADASEHVRTEVAFALGEVGESDGSVTAALAKLAEDDAAHVRLHAVNALSHLGVNAHSAAAVQALIERTTDTDPETRFDAVLGLARLGEAAAAAVPALRRCLRDDNRYVQGYAVEALDRIGTRDAIAAVMPYLKAQRWCPFTTEHSPFYP